jgi:hypothetical protein
MSQQADYSQEEWKTISAAPIMAGLLVSMSDLSGPVGMAKEAIAVVRSVTESASTSTNELIKAVSGGITAKGGKPDMPNLPADRASVLSNLVDGCRQAAAIVSQKSPGEAAEYKRWLVSLAQKTAEASKEGGFLGIGGTLVSDAESSAVKQLSSALGV